MELVRDSPGRAVGGMLFVADAADDSDETIDLFRQLASSKWAREAAIFVALTKLDVLIEARSGAAAARACCEAREAAYRAACPQRVAFACLNCRDPVPACRLIADAVADAVGSRAALALRAAAGGSGSSAAAQQTGRL